MTRIKGIHGDERWKLRPDITVNVYELNVFDECEWLGDYKVSELDDDWLNEHNELNSYGEDQDEINDFEWEDFGLEPCDECGDPINIMDAYTDEYMNQLKLND